MRSLKVLFFVVALVFCVQFAFAYDRTNFDSSIGAFGSVQTYAPQESPTCSVGQDFVIQIQPFGCSPSVVRSDLLAEQDVPVYCQLSATKLNPLIDVNTIENVLVTAEDYPEGVSGIGFHPAKGALGGYFGDSPLNDPVLNNIGYARIVLKQEKNESHLPDAIEGRLRAEITYNINDAFGFGANTFYLPQLSDDEWNNQYQKYSFWGRKGYLRVEDVNDNSAVIGVYDEGLRRIDSVVLEQGQSRSNVLLPGLSCSAGMSVRLDELTNPDTTALLNVDGDSFLLRDGEQFLENKCRVVDLEKNGLSENVDISCNEDDSFLGHDFSLTVSPKINLTLDGQEEIKSVGDYLFKSGDDYFYLGFIGVKDGANENDASSLYARLYSKPEKTPTLSKGEIALMNQIDFLAGDKIIDVTSFAGRGIALSEEALDWLRRGGGNDIVFADEEKRLGQGLRLEDNQGVLVGIAGFGSPVDIDLGSQELKEVYLNAMGNYDELLKSFPAVAYEADDISYGEKALISKIQLSSSLSQKRTAVTLCEELDEKYPHSEHVPTVCKEERLLSSNGFSDQDVLINNRAHLISFKEIVQPSIDDYSAEILVTGPNGRSQPYTLTKENPQALKGFRPESYFYYDSQIKTLLTPPGSPGYRTEDIKIRYSQNAWQLQLEKSSTNDDDTWKNIVSSDVSRLTDKQKGFFTIEELDKLFSGLSALNFDQGYALLYSLGFIEVNSEYISLNTLTPDQAKIDAKIIPEEFQKVGSFFLSEPFSLTLTKDQPQSFNGYNFLLRDVSLKREAKVHLESEVDFTHSNTSFDFKIGIEKRAIQLSPDQAKQTIAALNKSVEKFKKVSEGLGKTVQTLKTSCTVAGGALTLKNLIWNSKGLGVARQTVMRSVGGWNDKCDVFVQNGDYLSRDQCFLDNQDTINRDVDLLDQVMSQQNDDIKQLEEGITTEGLLGDRTVDTDEFVKRYVINVQGDLDTVLGSGSTFNDPSGNRENIDLENIRAALSYDVWKQSGSFDVEDLRSIELYTEVLREDPNNQFAKENLYALFSQVQTRSDAVASQLSYAEFLQTQSGLNEVTVRSYASTNTVQAVYDKGKAIGGGFGDIPQGSLVQGIVFKNKKYLVELEESRRNEYGVVKVYDESGKAIDENGKGAEAAAAKEIFDRFVFKSYDESSYKNTFQNPEVKYYETDPYQGLPAVVPFDKDGWYAATKPKLPVKSSVFSASQIAPFDVSGRVNSFYLCNVGSDGLVDFSQSGFGDDSCELINLGTGQPYNQFPNLESDRARQLVTSAVNAIEEASKQYASGVQRVRISSFGGLIPVGSPEFDTPAIQCQDFLSPGECNIVFNLCDPVICPSSRCDLGGKYPVRDVVQSGLVGSTLLCLPNAKEGIVAPVCLTGIQAGVDNLISVQESYQQCLQHGIETGESVGICNELHSIYLCDLVWREAAPFAQVAIPKIVETALDQNVRGGGEYLSLQTALKNTENSFDFFTQYYATNSIDAFEARSTEQFASGDLFCKNFASAVIPTDVGDFVGALNEPDSPPQYTGWFEQIPYSTVTNPPTSQYKVFYHIFAGKDRGAFYSVYMKGSGSSFFQDSSGTRVINSGFVDKGNFVSNTTTFTAPTGYTQLCLNVNGQEECGFGQASSSFALNYIQDQYVKSQYEAEDITSEEECISGSPSPYSLISSPNVQSSAEEFIDPAIYEQGIIRICATDNPGLQVDGSLQTTPRWKDVGTCGSPEFKCWLDTQSIVDAAHFNTTKVTALEDVNKDYQSFLQSEGTYLTPIAFQRELKNINDETDPEKKIDLVDETIKISSLDTERAALLLIKGDAYKTLAQGLFAKLLDEKTKAEFAQQQQQGTTTLSKTQTLTYEDFNAIQFVEGSCPVPLLTPGDEVDPFKRLQIAMSKLNQNPLPLGVMTYVLSENRDTDNCYDRARFIYKVSSVEPVCAFTYGDGPLTLSVEGDDGQAHPAQITSPRTAQETCVRKNPNQRTGPYDLREGDLISFAINVKDGVAVPHNAIFINWINPETGLANLFHGYNGKYTYTNAYSLKDGKDPVFQIWGIENAPTYQWTLDTALQQIVNLKGDYSDTPENKAFIDALYRQGYLTPDEYKDITGDGFHFEDSMENVKKILEEKKRREQISSSSTIDENDPLASILSTTWEKWDLDSAIEAAGQKTGPATSPLNEVFIKQLLADSVIDQDRYEDFFGIGFLPFINRVDDMQTVTEKLREQRKDWNIGKYGLSDSPLLGALQYIDQHEFTGSYNDAGNEDYKAFVDVLCSEKILPITTCARIKTDPNEGTVTNLIKLLVLNSYGVDKDAEEYGLALLKERGESVPSS